MSRLALLQLQVSVDESWLDYLIIGVYFVFVSGTGRSCGTGSDPPKPFLSGGFLPS